MPSKVSAAACARKSEEEERGGYPPDPPSEDDGTCADDGGGRDGPAAPRDDGVRDEDDVERLRLWLCCARTEPLLKLALAA